MNRNTEFSLWRDKEQGGGVVCVWKSVCGKNFLAMTSRYHLHDCGDFPKVLPPGRQVVKVRGIRQYFDVPVYILYT